MTCTRALAATLLWGDRGEEQAHSSSVVGQLPSLKSAPPDVHFILPKELDAEGIEMWMLTDRLSEELTDFVTVSKAGSYPAFPR